MPGWIQERFLCFVRKSVASSLETMCRAYSICFTRVTQCLLVANKAWTVCSCVTQEVDLAGTGTRGSSNLAFSFMFPSDAASVHSYTPQAQLPL